MNENSKAIVRYDNIQPYNLHRILIEESHDFELENERNQTATSDLNQVTSTQSEQFQRKLREKVFLAEVNYVDKSEKEKAFRSSEVYLGADLLSDDDIIQIKRQRQEIAIHREKANIYRSISRSNTVTYPPTHSTIRSGVALDTSRKFNDISASILSWDVNYNDVWSKRHNTLKRFIGLVSKWIIRQRVNKRLQKLAKFLKERGLVTKEKVTQYVIEDNQNISPNIILRRGPRSREAVSDSEKVLRAKSLAELAFGSHALFTSGKQAGLANKFPSSPVASAPPISFPIEDPLDEQIRLMIENHFKNDIVVIAPNKDEVALKEIQNTINEKSNNAQSIAAAIEAANAIQPVEERLQLPPLCFWANSNSAKSSCRPAADSGLSLSDLLGIPVENLSTSTCEFTDLSFEAPSWIINSQHDYTIKELNYLTPIPEFRTYIPEPNRCEMDDDWVLRPSVDEAKYQETDSLRTKWLKELCFLGVNTYLLEGREARCLDSSIDTNESAERPPSMFSYIYAPDNDRHSSGLLTYQDDHLRPLFSRDPGIVNSNGEFLLSQQSYFAESYLSESESDDEDNYISSNQFPSIARVKQIRSTAITSDCPDLYAIATAAHVSGQPNSPQAKGSQQAANKKLVTKNSNLPVKSSPRAIEAQLTVENDKDVQIVEEEFEGVELERVVKLAAFERKHMEYKHSNIDQIASYLTSVSKASGCLVNALPVSLPYHSYSSTQLHQSVLNS